MRVYMLSDIRQNFLFWHIWILFGFFLLVVFSLRCSTRAKSFSVFFSLSPLFIYVWILLVDSYHHFFVFQSDENYWWYWYTRTLLFWILFICCVCAVYTRMTAEPCCCCWRRVRRYEWFNTFQNNEGKEYDQHLAASRVSRCKNCVILFLFLFFNKWMWWWICK